MVTLFLAALALGATPLYKDPSQPIPARVSDLLCKMTQEEKQAQLGYGGGQLCSLAAAKRFPLGVGGVSAGGLACTNAGQTALMNMTRLGIPASFIAETTHSGGVGGTTNMPMPVSQGASWNISMVEDIGRINALELRSSGGDQGLSPILQVCTDPRFSRMEENFGEDPLLVAQYGVAALTGLQGHDGLGGVNSYLGSPATHVVSQAKHYAMYGAGPKDGYTPMGGGPSTRTVFEVYLRPWRDFAQAGGRGVMASHNMIDWIPCHGNKKMLTDTLRNRFGLHNGYIGSDNTNVEGLSGYFRGFASNDSDAAVIAMEAGVDQDMPGGTFVAEAAKLVAGGQLAAATLDRAVANILTKKFASGLFDHPTIDPAMGINVNNPAHRHAAREAAIQGCVLLKNEGAKPTPWSPDSGMAFFLPVKASAVKNVAIIGPFADDVDAMHGGYSPGPIGPPPLVADWDGATAPGNTVESTTVVGAFKARGFNTTVVQGASGGRGGPGNPGHGNDVVAAQTAAASADLTVVVVGASSCTCCGRCGNGEAGDRQSLDLEGDQVALLAAVANVTKNFVVVLVHGRPLSFGQDNAVLDSIPSLLASWRSGEEGGNAIADLIFGDAAPSGRLAQAWPRSAGAIHGPANPWYQTHSSMTGSFYFPNGDGSPMSALFPFGFGLSYTTFAVANGAIGGLGSLVNGTGLAAVTATITLDVTNTGPVAASVPIMATFSKETRLVVRYLRMMAGFTKVMVPAGKTVTAEITVSMKELARYDPDQKWTDLTGTAVQGAYVVDGGSYDFFVGDCVSVGPVWNDANTCAPSRQLELSLNIGRAGETFVYL